MKRQFFLLLAFIALLGNVPAQAQWTTDTSVNTRITPATMPDGGTYYSETNSNGVTYLLMEDMLADNKCAMYLQIVDKDGVKLFEDKGLKISEELNISYIDLLPGQRITIDNEGNAIVAINDQRTGGYSYTLYKFDEKGNMVWGDVQLYNAQSMRRAASISICQTTDGGYVAAYMGNVKSDFSKDPFVAVEKISKDGKLVWDEPIKIGFEDNEDKCNDPFLVDAGMNQCYLVYSKGINQTIMARLIDFDGSSAWGEDVEVYNGGCWGVMPMYLMLNVAEGPENGLLVSWRDMRPMSIYQNCISYITNEGTYGFSTGVEGTLISNDEEFSKYQAEMMLDEKDNSIYCLYRKFSQSQQQFNGLSMQKISKDGELLWGPDGKSVVDIQGENGIEFYSIRNIDDNRFAVFYQEGIGGEFFGKCNSYVLIYDKDGNVLSDKLNFTTTDFGKMRLRSSELIDNSYFVTVWDEYRLDPEDGDANHGDLSTFMQKVNLNDLNTGIENVSGNAGAPVKSEIFTVSGKKLGSFAQGVNIVRTTDAEGNVTVKKITK